MINKIKEMLGVSRKKSDEIKSEMSLAAERNEQAAIEFRKALSKENSLVGALSKISEQVK